MVSIITPCPIVLDFVERSSVGIGLEGRGFGSRNRIVGSGFCGI